MSSKFPLIFIMAIIPMALPAPPVFLAGGGSKICTLNVVGKIPNGLFELPVYQKVCREVISSMGDFVNDDIEIVSGNEPPFLTDDRDEAERVHRAILAIYEKREHRKRK